MYKFVNMPKIISSRVEDQLIEYLGEYMEAERLEKSVAIRRLLYDALMRWRREKALKLLKEGKVTFMKAAQLAGLDVWEFADLVRKSKVIWIRDLKRIKADIESTLA